MGKGKLVCYLREYVSRNLSLYINYSASRRVLFFFFQDPDFYFVKLYICLGKREIEYSGSEIALRFKSEALPECLNSLGFNRRLPLILFSKVVIRRSVEIKYTGFIYIPMMN